MFSPTVWVQCVLIYYKVQLLNPVECFFFVSTHVIHDCLKLVKKYEIHYFTYSFDFTYILL